MVALRKESVDRNFHAVQIVIIVMVALRKESVDRNTLSPKSAPCEAPVALRKESVDRNSTASIMQPQATGRSPQGERG